MKFTLYKKLPNINTSDFIVLDKGYYFCIFNMPNENFFEEEIAAHFNKTKILCNAIKNYQELGDFYFKKTPDLVSDDYNTYKKNVKEFSTELKRQYPEIFL